MKELLLETYRAVKKASNLDPTKPRQFRQILLNDRAFNTYVRGLAESLTSEKERTQFTQLCENTRIGLTENSMYGINPYETLALPVLRVFYPKLVAKEAVTVSPMDKPDTVKAYINSTFTKAGSTYQAPVTTTDISRGPSLGLPVAATLALPANKTNLLALLSPSKTKTDVHLQRDFVITQVSDGTNTTDVNIVPDVEGNFSASVLVNAVADVIVGTIDYLNGTISAVTTASVVKAVKYSVSCSLEENKVNPTSEIKIEKIRLYARDRQISTSWTINMEQDLRALFDLSMQTEVVNLIGQQIATDIDNEIISSLDAANTRLNGVAHTLSFDRTPPDDYTWGDKYWHENIVTKLNLLSNQIYVDTNMEAGNTILANPLDSAILEDINSFAYTSGGGKNGELGYRSATITGGKWNVLVSSIVPQGKMLVVFKPAEELKTVFYYAPYIPAILHPYPLGATPSLTILSRYATALVRSNGIAALTIGA